ncbi:MAG: hypothetical protein JSV56_12210 [Methanomassiliicoccales archaeon]|nr:MAG: hypothetical protein JSV56_12210 [Methanomassiliicoccales archaeon]
MARERPGPRYGYEEERRSYGGAEGGLVGRRKNYCPNCGREIFTDPDNCVLCGWSRTAEERRAPPRDDPRGRYPPRRDEGYRREMQRRQPPDDWERQVEERMRGRRAAPRGEDRRTWYKAETERRGSKKEKVLDRLVCENCGNPSLQFFADGLGRCPGCGQRFRYSSRPTTLRSKQKHKQFICSQCDSKNLQFFLDGKGVCPHCKREFRWKK